MRKGDMKAKDMGKENISMILKEASAFKNFISRGNVVDMTIGEL